MKPESFDVSHQPSAAAWSEAGWIGLAAQVLGSVAELHGLPLAHLREWLVPAMRHRQVKFFFDADGRPAGYVAWALLAEDVEQRFVGERRWQLHESEWNEGESVWIVDFAARPGYLRSIVRELKDAFFADLKRIRYARAGTRSIRLRQLSRQDGSRSLEFLRAGDQAS